MPSNYQLSPELLALLQQYGRIDSQRLNEIGVADPGAYGDLSQARRVDNSQWINTYAGNEDGGTSYRRDQMELAARQLGIDPTYMSNEALYSALTQANDIAGQYTLTQDQGDGPYGAQTRARQNFTVDESGRLVAAGDQQALDLNPTSTWRSNQDLTTMLALMGTLGAASAAGVGAGAASGAGEAATLGAAENGILGSTVGSGSAYSGAAGLTEAELASMAAAGDVGGFPAGSSGAPISQSQVSTLGNGASMADRMSYLQQNGFSAETARALANSVSGDGWGRLLTSLGLGAISAMGPNSQTSTQTSQMDPGTQAYVDQIRQRALALPTSISAPAGSVTTPTDGLAQALAGLQGAQATQNGLLQQSQGLIGQGTTPMTSAQNGLLGDVQSYIGSATAPRTATANAYFGQDNPYTSQAVDFATGDLNRAYTNNVAPKFASGSSFGSSGLAFAELQARDDLARRQAQMVNDMRMRDLTAQQQLGESAAGRQDSINNLLSQLSMTGAGLLGNLGESAAGRQDSVNNANQNRFLTGASMTSANSQIPVQTASTLFNAANNLWSANNANTNQANSQWRFEQGYPLEVQRLLSGAVGPSNTTQSTETPNGSAWSRFAGGALAGMQAYNTLANSGGGNRASKSLWSGG